MEKYDEVELKIIATMQKFEKDAKAQKLIGNGKWTDKLINCLGILGRDMFGSNPCASKQEHFDPEWLYDLIWYKEEGEDENCRLVDVSLVMECEWKLGLNHIRYDFEKLLIANASHRLMVCDAQPGKKEDILEYFRHAIKSYRLGYMGDRFLIAILDHETNEFSFELMIKG